MIPAGRVVGAFICLAGLVLLAEVSSWEVSLSVWLLLIGNNIEQRYATGAWR